MELVPDGAAAGVAVDAGPRGYDLATWKGRVLDTKEAPVPHAIVRLVRSDLRGPRVGGSTDEAPEGDTLEVICDGAGLFEVHGVRPGAYLVGARGPPALPLNPGVSRGRYSIS